MESIDLIVEKIKKIWKANPDLRLGQMLCQTANYGVLYYSENDDLIKILEDFYHIDTSDVQPISEEKIRQSFEKIVAESNRRKSNAGRIYIHNDNGEVKAIIRDDWDSYVTKGWTLGRK